MGQGQTRPRLLDQIEGRNREGEPQAWRQNLGKGSQINNRSRAVDALQSGQHALAQRKLAVVVIFKNKGARASGEIKKAKAPIKTEGRAGRKLVRGRNADQSRRRPVGRKVRIKTGGVARDSDHLRPLRPENGGTGKIAGLLHPDPILTLQTQGGEQRHARPGRGQDQHLVRLRQHTPAGRQMPGYRRAQGGVAFGRAKGEVCRRQAPTRRAQMPGEHLGRKSLHIGNPGRQRQEGPRRRFAHKGRRRRGADLLARSDKGDARRRARPCLQIALRLQPLQRLDHG